MSNPLTVVDFQFVNATPGTPRAPDDKAVRVLIRKHAMKQTAAARRRQGNYGRHNLLQYPVFDDGTVQKSSGASQCTRAADEFSKSCVCGDENCLQVEYKKKAPEKALHLSRTKHPHVPCGSLSRLKLPPSLSRQGYEAVTAAYGFDVADLSSLASLHLGRLSGRMLSANPSQLGNLLRCNQWSYLAYLPGRYGYSTCLNDAVDCIIARVRQILSPHESKLHGKVIPMYVKALNSLQRALDSPVQCYEAEVLCAIEILALYEFFNPSSTAAWIRHAAGAARVIQLRGPQSYKTDFEKALFMAHVSPIMTETMLNNERCFLEEAPWKALMESLILDSVGLSERSEIAISLLILKSRVPGVYKDVTSIICDDNDLNELTLKSVIHNTSELRTDLKNWLSKYRDILALPYDAVTNAYGYEIRSEIICTYLSCSMITSRLSAAISAAERADSEVEAQQFASQTLDLERVTKPVSPYAMLFLAQAVAVAGSIKSTTREWMMSTRTEGDCESVLTPVIERRKFEYWCGIIGRKVS